MARVCRYLAYSLREALHRSSSRVIDLFHQLDVDRKGAIDLREFLTGIAALGFDAPKEDLTQMFHEWDRNHSGEIDFKELNSQMRKGLVSKPKAKLEKRASALLQRTGTLAKEQLQQQLQQLQSGASAAALALAPVDE